MSLQSDKSYAPTHISSRQATDIGRRLYAPLLDFFANDRFSKDELISQVQRRAFSRPNRVIAPDEEKGFIDEFVNQSFSAYVRWAVARFAATREGVAAGVLNPDKGIKGAQPDWNETICELKSERLTPALFQARKTSCKGRGGHGLKRKAEFLEGLYGTMPHIFMVVPPDAYKGKISGSIDNRHPYRKLLTNAFDTINECAMELFSKNQKMARESDSRAASGKRRLDACAKPHHIDKRVLMPIASFLASLRWSKEELESRLKTNVLKRIENREFGEFIGFAFEEYIRAAMRDFAAGSTRFSIAKDRKGLISGKTFFSIHDGNVVFMDHRSSFRPFTEIDILGEFKEGARIQPIIFEVKVNGGKHRNRPLGLTSIYRRRIDLIQEIYGTDPRFCFITRSWEPGIITRTDTLQILAPVSNRIVELATRLWIENNQPMEQLPCAMSTTHA